MKKWIKVSRGPNGPRMVTVTLVDGNLTARNTVKAFGTLAAAVKEAETEAEAWLDALRRLQ